MKSVKMIKNMGKQLGFIGLLATAAMATDARIESMGKSSRFIMDDVSIFDNAANIGIYPNFLIGEMGGYTQNVAPGVNKDPQAPWFGGIFSIGTGEGATKDPRFTIGGALNRVDPLLNSFLPDSVRVVGAANSPTVVAIPKPVTNFDGFLGFSTKSGNLFGSHIYIALQDGATQDSIGNYSADANAFASIVKADLGMNVQLNEDLDWEMSGGVARIAFGPQSRDFWSPGEWSFFGKGRMFSTVELINGEFVPQGEFRFIQTEGRKNTYYNGGAGVNVALDRGFFWLGVEGYYNKDEVSNYQKDASGEVIFDDFSRSKVQAYTDIYEELGTQISFGIEKNIWYDWLVVRVGGKKSIAYAQNNPSEASQNAKTALYGNAGNYWKTNPIGDASSNDHVGFGIGINVEEKLKIDATLAEDLLYRNPFQGEGRLISRVSATYSF